MAEVSNASPCDTFALETGSTLVEQAFVILLFGLVALSAYYIMQEMSRNEERILRESLANEFLTHADSLRQARQEIVRHFHSGK